MSNRHQSQGTWSTDYQDPIWQPRGSENPEGPPVVVFYSPKGGLGRSTALASFAIRQAQDGDRVAVLDLDLDAPGIGTLLTESEPSKGVLDLLLDQEGATPLSDCFQSCRRKEIVGSGELFVFHAGTLDSTYPDKVASVRWGSSDKNLLATILHRVREEMKPDWILIDAPSGLSESAGAMLSGLAHLHVLFGTPSEQSWMALRVAIERLGARRVSQGMPQLDCLLVQAMVPPDTMASKVACSLFEQRARDEFTDTEHGYYAEDSEDAWDLLDIETEDAPHRPIPLTYDMRLAYANGINDIVSLLTEEPEYRNLAERITDRFAE